MIKEFKEFISRGNVMDLAIGIIIGGAFAKIVSSLVNDLLMPLVGLVLGGVNFNELFYAVGGEYETLAQAEEAGVTIFRYGSFIQSIVDFLIIALCIFLIVRSLNKARARRSTEEEKSPTEKTCFECAMNIPVAANKCPYCTTNVR